MTPSEKLKTARVKIVYTYWYLADAIYQMPLIEIAPKPQGEGAPEGWMATMGVDKYWRLYYDPKFVEDTPMDELVGVFYHEVMHILRDHAGRATNFAELLPIVWNVGADCEINDDCPVKLPGDACRPANWKMPDNKLAEFYYDHLMKNHVQIVECTGCGGGSGVDGKTKPWEKEPKDGDGPDGPVGPTRKIGQGEGNLIRRKVAENIQAAKSRGTVPADLARFAEEFLSSKTPWQKILMSKINSAITYKAGMVDYTYTRPARRQMGDFIMPSLRAPEISLSIVIDTSGSMDDKAMGLALAEVEKILKTCCIGRLDVISCDADVNFQKHFVTATNQIKLGGGGGTDMRVGMEAAMKAKPSCIIVITDGYTPWPDSAPRARVIVALVGEGTVPDWADTVRVED